MSKANALPGRSLKRGEVTAEELRNLTKDFEVPEHLLDVGVNDDAVVVEGDLVVPTLDTFANGVTVLVVTGDLRVEGTYLDYDDPATGVFVLWSLFAKNVSTAGALFVKGDLVVGETLLGDMNDYGANIRGNVEARVFVPENHYFEVGGKAQFEVVLGWKASSQISVKIPKALEGLKLREALAKEVLQEDAYELDDEDVDSMGYDDLVEHSELVDRVHAGQPVLR